MTGFGTTVDQTQAVISLRAYMNPEGPTQQAVLNYETPDSQTAAASSVLTVTVAPSTTNHLIDLPTLLAAYTAPIFVSITDISASPGVGFKITTVSGSGKCGVAANGWWAYMGDGTTALPQVYVDNANTTTTLVLSIGVMSA